jgi:hypothetical protein
VRTLRLHTHPTNNSLSNHRLCCTIMAHQTRSRGTTPTPQQRAESSMEASAPHASHAEEASSGSSGARMPLDRAAGSGEYHSSTPEASSRPREQGGASASSSSRSRDRSARSWDERDRRDGPRAGSGPLFSPPSYKVRLCYCYFVHVWDEVVMFWYFVDDLEVVQSCVFVPCVLLMQVPHQE